MIKQITAVERNGFNVRTMTVTCDVPEAGFDLLNAIKKASEEFVKTGAGKMVLEYNCGYFNLADFESSVPNEICEKYGFQKLDVCYAEEDIDWDMSLVEGASEDLEF